MSLQIDVCKVKYMHGNTLGRNCPFVSSYINKLSEDPVTKKDHPPRGHVPSLQLTLKACPQISRKERAGINTVSLMQNIRGFLQG